MRKMLIILPFLFGFTSIPPEVLTPVEVSNRDVNRIICTDTVQDVVYSKEKPLELKVIERNIFVKFLIKQEGGKEIYYTQKIDMHVICGDSIYDILLIPKDITSQTLLLKNAASKVKKNLSSFKGMAHEAKLIKLLRIAYTEEFPDGFTVTDLTGKKEFEASVDYSDIDLRARRKVMVEGTGLVLTEYVVTADKSMELRETDFLGLSKKPYLIALEQNKLPSGGSARLFIIEPNSGEMQ